MTPIADLDQAATDLAHFLRALWQIDATDGPAAPRGRPLSQKDEETKQALATLAGVIDTKAVSAIWQHCLNAPEWSHAPVCFHGDLLPTNLLVRDGRIVAVIDFDLMGVGDPAIDMLPAWSLFDSSSRKTFRRALAIDDATWVRGCGWALNISLTILPYYRDTNPTLTAIAHRMIREILNGEDGNVEIKSADLGQYRRGDGSLAIDSRTGEIFTNFSPFSLDEGIEFDTRLKRRALQRLKEPLICEPGLEFDRCFGIWKKSSRFFMAGGESDEDEE